MQSLYRVILNEVKNLKASTGTLQILRFAQDDNIMGGSFMAHSDSSLRSE